MLLLDFLCAMTLKVRFFVQFLVCAVVCSAWPLQALALIIALIFEKTVMDR